MSEYSASRRYSKSKGSSIARMGVSKCVWTSIKPGITNPPAASSFGQLEVSVAESAIPTIRPFSICKFFPATISPEGNLMSRQFTKFSDGDSLLGQRYRSVFRANDTGPAMPPMNDTTAIASSEFEIHPGRAASQASDATIRKKAKAPTA